MIQKPPMGNFQVQLFASLLDRFYADLQIMLTLFF